MPYIKAKLLTRAIPAGDGAPLAEMIRAFGDKELHRQCSITLNSSCHQTCEAGKLLHFLLKPQRQL
jgi:hypothetical protein